MNEQFLDPKWRRSMLSKIHEGMMVFDQEGAKVGVVDKVYVGRMATESAEYLDDQEYVTYSELPEDDDFYEDFGASMFPEDEVRAELQENMMRRGFLRIKGDGIEGSNRYILPSQIEVFDEAFIRLQKLRDDLTDREK